jgi:hypothetical protein
MNRRTVNLPPRYSRGYARTGFTNQTGSGLFCEMNLYRWYFSEPHRLGPTTRQLLLPLVCCGYVATRLTDYFDVSPGLPSLVDPWLTHVRS